MALNWTEIEKDVSAHRADIVERLVQFSLNDVLLFLSPESDLRALQEQKWLPVLRWIKQNLKLDFKTTETLESPTENMASAINLQNFLSSLTNRQLTALYIAAVHMRSVLLAMAMVKGRLSAQEAFELSELEELYQAERWGKDFEAEQRRESLKHTLSEVENYLQ